LSTSYGGTEPRHDLLLYKGAEADIIRGEWQGMDAVYKVRKPLAYRLPVLDDAIRRQRTSREAEMIHLTKRAGVSAPYLYAVDVPRSTLVMEYVQGERLKDRMSSMEDTEAGRIFQEFGEDAARLHRAGIVHGDLTTANVVVRDGGLVFIDFGLAFRTSRVEDQAVDLRLIKETLFGAHPEVSRLALEELFRGYAKVSGAAKFRTVHRQLGSIERRGRYARVT
jgi:TP53 regulating kinase and related kinases